MFSHNEPNLIGEEFFFKFCAKNFWREMTLPYWNGKRNFHFLFFFFFFFFVVFLSLQLSSSFTKNSSEVVSREGSMLPPPLLHPREWKDLTGDFKTQPDSVLFQAVAIVKKVLQKPARIEQSHRLTSGWVLKSSLKLHLPKCLHY